MPELPEVHTTVEGLKKVIIGKTIKDVWSDFHLNTAHGHRKNLKNKKYFENFKKTAIGSKIKDVRRIGKNVLIDLNPSTSSRQANTIVVHMKMTGHLMASGYNTKDPFNGHIHFRLSFADGEEMVLSDTRKFASVCLAETKNLSGHEGLKDLGTDALTISFKEFEEKIKRKKNWPVKSALMDQTTLAGVGNIYSDEILWQTSVHPLSKPNKIPDKKLGEIFKEMKRILRFSIKKGGDSKSDYRNALGEKGGFQNFHQAYGRKGKRCEKSKCRGIIERMVVRGRSSHFCLTHQKIYS